MTSYCVVNEGKQLKVKLPNKITTLDCCLATQLCPTLCNPMDCSLPVSSVMEFDPVIKLIELILCDVFDPVIEPWSPALQADSLPSEPAGKPHSRISVSRFKI